MVVASPGAGSSMPDDKLKPAPFAPLERIHSSEIPPAEGMLALNVEINARGDEVEGGSALSRRKTTQSRKSVVIEGVDSQELQEVEEETGEELEEFDYPDGGRKAWGVVAVSGCRNHSVRKGR